MEAINKGRAWVFGDNVDTDALAPGRFMHRPFEELAQNCLIDLSPEFAESADEGDIIIAGRNFGVGSSRDQAAQALKSRGLSAIVAKGFAGIFYRNASQGNDRGGYPACYYRHFFGNHYYRSFGYTVGYGMCYIFA